MSDFPGYPSPFSTWNLPTSIRTVFPLGNIPVPGLASGLSTFLEPGYYTGVGPGTLPDPLAPFLCTSYRPPPPPPPVSSRYLPSLTELPALGIEPLYGCGLREPRGIAHSPNFLFSQNPSPLTFDQIYRSSGSNSVSPVSQYRNQFDQRYVNTRLLVPGRLSEPLVRKTSSLPNVKNKEEKTQQSKEIISKSNCHTEDKNSDSKVSNQERNKKIWNPFEAETKVSAINGSAQETVSHSKEGFNTLINNCSDSKCVKTLSVASEKEKEHNKKSISEVTNNAKLFPTQAIPQYPVKPIPLYENPRFTLPSSTEKLDHISSISSTFNHSITVSSLSNAVLKDQHNQLRDISAASSNKTLTDTPKEEGTLDSSVSSDCNKVNKIEKDLNENLQAEENNNHSKFHEIGSSCGLKSNCYEPSVSLPFPLSCADSKLPSSGLERVGVKAGELDKSDVIIVSDTEEGNPVKPDIPDCVQFSGNKEFKSDVYNQFQEGSDQIASLTQLVNNQNNYFQLQLQIENDHSDAYVPYLSSLEDKIVDNTELQLDSSDLGSSFVATLNENCGSSNEVKPQSECFTPPSSSLENSESKQHPQSKSLKSKSLLSPKKNKDSTKKKDLKDELSVLSNQVNEIRNRRNSVNKDASSPRLKSPSFKPFEDYKDTSESIKKSSVPQKVGNHCRYRRKMAAAPGTLTVMKNSEDSLSASISSSQISESDSDTQLSTDNADKLFVESQSENTHNLYADNPVSDQPPYLSPNSGNGNCDNQFFKSNNPAMCQSESDNQKPYLCVQEPNRFNEKSPILPPYNCYAPNQSANVLPAEEESFQSHHDDEITNFQQPNPEVLDQVDSAMDYDENSVMSETNTTVECDSQMGMPHVTDPGSNKPSLLETIQNSVSFLASNDDEWEFLHSKQYIDNIYYQHAGCEPVKNEDGIRESDSPKTFIDLDTTTKEKKAQEKMKRDIPFMKGSLSGKHYGKSLHHQGYSGGARMSHNMYGNQYDNYGGMGSQRWNNYSRNGNDGSLSKHGGERDGGQYDQNQYRHGYQPNYYPMNHGQNGGDKMYNQSGYHGNEYGQNDSGNYYNQGQPMKGFQGNFGNDGRYDSSYYQNKPTNDYTTQGNMYPPTSTDMPNSRYNNQSYAGNQGGYSQHYTQQSPSHSGSNSMVQYQNTPNPNFSLPRNASPAGSDFGEPGPGTIKKKRGRKRKADKEPHDDSKPKPNTIVQATVNIGPMIDVDHPDCPIETYDYNHQIETIFNYRTDDDLSPLGVQFLEMEQRLCKKMMPIKYGHPVNVIYCPLTYAFQTHRDFVAKYLTSERPILFLGMNPGPYGMSQNGVSAYLLSV